MPPRKRQDPEPEAEFDLELPVCPECFPGGWLDDHDRAMCVHGEWDRYPAPEPEPPADPPADPPVVQ